MSTRVGTRSFQAPEVLMGKQYDNRCDIFSIGVMFFLMVTGGMPPFQAAEIDDRWYKYIAAGFPNKFWKKQRKAKKHFSDPGADDLFMQLCHYQPQDRIRTDDVFNHPWMSGEQVDE